MKEIFKILFSSMVGGGAQHSSPMPSNVFWESCKSHINPLNGQIPFLSYCAHISLKLFPGVFPLAEISQGNKEEEIHIMK